MRIATFNVNGINGRLAHLLDWLEDYAPDIACLQELKSPGDRFPAEAIEQAGYGAIWHGEARWNGVAILAKGAMPIETGRGLDGDPADGQCRYIEAACSGVLIGCLYLPNGNPWPGPRFNYKLAWADRLARRAATLFDIGMPVVLAGDYNIIPADKDVYNPARWTNDALFRPESRAAFAALIESGWCDALRAIHPDEPMFTFWHYWRNSFARDAGIRIDHLLLNSAAAALLAGAGVDRNVRAREKASDHAPVWIELDVG